MPKKKFSTFSSYLPLCLAVISTITFLAGCNGSGCPGRCVPEPIPFVHIMTYQDAVARYGPPTTVVDCDQVKTVVWTKYDHSRQGMKDLRRRTCEVIWRSDKLVFDQCTGDLLRVDTVNFIQQKTAYAHEAGFSSKKYPAGTRCSDYRQHLDITKPPLVWPIEKMAIKGNGCM